MFPRPTARGIAVSSVTKSDERVTEPLCDCPGCVVSRMINDCEPHAMPALLFTLGRGVAHVLAAAPPDTREAWLEDTLDRIEAAVAWQLRGPEEGDSVH